MFTLDHDYERLNEEKIYSNTQRATYKMHAIGARALCPISARTPNPAIQNLATLENPKYRVPRREKITKTPTPELDERRRIQTVS